MYISNDFKGELSFSPIPCY